VLYPRFTALDLVGPHKYLAAIPGMQTVLVAENAGLVPDESGTLPLVAHHSFDEVIEPDIVLVPGGPGPGRPTADGALADWLRAVDSRTTWTTSVCTGSIILAAAGILTGRRATTHFLGTGDLEFFGAQPVARRVVFDGKYVTAAGVSAGIDMGLTLMGMIAGDAAAKKQQLVTEYAPEPPYDAGSVATAPDDIVNDLRARRADLLWKGLL
jgi:transcriptional regulator GlxA family with amidase domain